MQCRYVLHITDCHLFEDEEYTKNGLTPAETLRQVLQRAVAQQVPHAVIATGDIAHEPNVGVYRRFSTELNKIFPGPVLVVPGNHDHGGSLEAVFDQQPIDLGAWSILPLDTHVDANVSGFISSRSLNRFTSLLTHARQHCLIAGHHPLFEIGTTWLDEHRVSNTADLLRHLKKKEFDVTYVCGHVHSTNECTQNGIRQLTTPSTCWQFKPKVSSFELDDMKPGWRWLGLHPDGSLTTSVYRID